LDALVFEERGKLGVPGEKPLGAERRTNNKLKPHMTPGPVIEPGTHWWETSALTTATSLLHVHYKIGFSKIAILHDVISISYWILTV